MEEFNLSEEIQPIDDYYPIEPKFDFVKVEDVKEFIKRLKIEIFENFREGSKPRDPLEIIDKLAGEKLC